MPASAIYCAYCTRQQVMYVDLDTVRDAGVVMLECVECHRLTKVGIDQENGALMVAPAGVSPNPSK